jgi:hypothetical protein
MATRQSISIAVTAPAMRLRILSGHNPDVGNPYPPVQDSQSIPDLKLTGKGVERMLRFPSPCWCGDGVARKVSRLECLRGE